MALLKTTYTLRAAAMLFSLCATAIPVAAQNTYLNYGSEEYDLVDRLETRSGYLISAFNTASKPYSRKDVVDFLAEVQRASRTRGLVVNDIDAYNIGRAISISGEWYTNSSGEGGAIESRRPVLRYFYKKQPDLLHIDKDDFFMVVNPVLYLQGGYEKDGGFRSINTRGVEVRGRIANRVGFYTMLADNQEKVPAYIDEWATRHRGQFPGEHYSVKNGNNYDFFLARGYIDFALWRDHVGLTFGYDRNQIGYGIRSLVISNSTAPATFLRLRSQWGDFSYENLYTELVSNNTVLLSGDGLLPRKYASIHQLNYTPNHWLNVGIFESTVFAKQTGVPVEMIVPVIGYQSLAKQMGIGNTVNNNAWGLQFKALPLSGLQLYGQLYIDRADWSALGSASWKNQYAAQLGVKYFNVAGVPNLDAQAEFNIIRPFTYMAQEDSITSFTHYNQPLAHPMGNNYAELIAQLRYQPVPRLNITARAIVSKRGMDSAQIGNGIYGLSDQRMAGDSYPMFSGVVEKGIFGNLNAAYEVRPNIYVEAGGNYFRKNSGGISSGNNLFLYAGLRWNISRRIYDIY